MEDFFAVETAAGIILFEFRFMVVTEFMGGNNIVFHRQSSTKLVEFLIALLFLILAGASLKVFFISKFFFLL